MGHRRPVRADGGVPLCSLLLSGVTIAQQGIDIAATSVFLLNFFLFCLFFRVSHVMLNIFINHLCAPHCVIVFLFVFISLTRTASLVRKVYDFLIVPPRIKERKKEKRNQAREK